MSEVKGEMRTGSVTRKTSETDIKVVINLDGFGDAKVSSGIGFFDHLLVSFARHGRFDLEVEAKGDLEVDGHHTIEDLGLCLGAAFRKALDASEGFARFGHAVVPMDDALIMTAVDLSGRPYLDFQLDFGRDTIGQMDLSLVEEFFRAFAVAAGLNLHLQQWAGKNDHHVAEAAFKAFGRALNAASTIDLGVKGVLSTKGRLREDWE